MNGREIEVFPLHVLLAVFVPHHFAAVPQGSLGGWNKPVRALVQSGWLDGLLSPAGKLFVCKGKLQRKATPS